MTIVMLWILVLLCSILRSSITNQASVLLSGGGGGIVVYAATTNNLLSKNEIRRSITGGGRLRRQEQQQQQRRLQESSVLLPFSEGHEEEYNDDAQASACSTDVIIHHTTSSSYTGPNDNDNEISSYTPMMPVGRSFTNIQEEATKFHNEFRHQSLKQRQVNPRIDDMLVTIPQNGKFIFLGQVPHHDHLEPELVMSFFNGDILHSKEKVELVNTTIQYQNMKEHKPYKWRVIQPPQKALQEATQNIITLPEGPSEYVIFVAPWFFVYQHLLIDHIGIWSLLRDELSTTKPDVHFVFVGSQNGSVQKYILEVIDPEFLNRITFLDCTKIEWCGYQMIQVSTAKPTKLSLFLPKVSPRHVDLLERARRWIFNSPQLMRSTTLTSNNDSSTSSSSSLGVPANSASSLSFSETTDMNDDIRESDNHIPVELPPPPSTAVLSSSRRTTTDGTNQQRKKTIIYCQRSEKGRANRGRIMNAEQETLIIDMIQDTMTLYGRPEQLVVFDGSGMTILEQIQLFSSASIVIGPHGGALANLLFTSPHYHHHQDGVGHFNNSTTTTTTRSPYACSERTKVIEFVKSSDTRSIQPSREDYALSFYYLYNTIPWIEYHQLYFRKPSNHNETFINLIDLQDALQSVMMS